MEKIYKKKFINKILDKTVENVFENPRLSYSNALKKAVNDLEDKFKKIVS